MGMAQVVESDAGQGGLMDDPHPFMRDECRLHHASGAKRITNRRGQGDR